MILSNHLILCCPLLLWPSIFPSIRVFSDGSLCIRWPKCWSFSFSISPSNEYSEFISFRIDWFDPLALFLLLFLYKLPQTEWLKMTWIYHLTFLEVRRSKMGLMGLQSRCQQGCVPSGGTRHPWCFGVWRLPTFLSLWPHHFNFRFCPHISFCDSVPSFPPIKSLVIAWVHPDNPRAFLVTQLVKTPPVMQETPVQFLGQEDPLDTG